MEDKIWNHQLGISFDISSGVTDAKNSFLTRLNILFEMFAIIMCCFDFPQKNVHSTRFVTYFCEHVLPNLSSLTTPAEGLDIQLEVN